MSIDDDMKKAQSYTYAGPLLEALVKKLEGEIEIAKANIGVYQTNAAGIGEHPDIVEAIEAQIAKIAEADDKIETIRKYF
tara:strand:+ start:1605 stop:1844 length:240 start_codon:yes stop_codon:yes gene_type:complete